MIFILYQFVNFANYSFLMYSIVLLSKGDKYPIVESGNNVNKNRLDAILFSDSTY